jgi:Domain of Unknown Function (DUF1521)
VIAPVGEADLVVMALPFDDAKPLVVSVQRDDPLPAPAFAKTSMPDEVTVTLVTLPSAQALAGPQTMPFAITTVMIGRFEVDLSDGYILSVDQPNAEVSVANTLTHESLRIWGDAQIALDGAELARFWGTTSVVLGNGTKLTLETRPGPETMDLFRLDRLTVTREQRALIIEGIASETEDALAVRPSFDGYIVDQLARDGLTIERSAEGWSGESGETVTEAFFAQTAPEAEYAPGTQWQSLAEATGLIADFLAWGQAAFEFGRAQDDLTRDLNDVTTRSPRVRAPERYHLALALAASSPALA